MGQLDRFRNGKENEDLARSMCETLKLRPDEKRIHSFKNKISDLDRGITTWWLKDARAKERAALAKALGMPESVLFDLPTSPASMDSFPIAEWPEVPPLNFTRMSRFSPSE